MSALVVRATWSSNRVGRDLGAGVGVGAAAPDVLLCRVAFECWFWLLGRHGHRLVLGVWLETGVVWCMVFG